MPADTTPASPLAKLLQAPSPAARPVQLAAAERAQVYINADNGRILGFGPDGASPSLPPTFRVRTIVCYHARDIERYAEAYRRQCHEDDEQATEAQLARERPMRAALRDSVLERNRQLSSDLGNPHAARNIALNNVLLRVQEELYTRMMMRRTQRVATIAAERYEAGTRAVDVALESPLIQTEKFRG